jgi:hypothetical protein
MPLIQNPDDVLIVIFHDDAVPNPSKTAAAGRPMFDDREVCEIRTPGSRDIKFFPAHAQADWVTDPLTGEQTRRTYAEKFSRQYLQFKAKVAQTRTGTPLALASFLTAGKRLELQALSIYTVEALAHIDGQELKNLGFGGRELKLKAEQYIEDAKGGVEARQALQKVEALEAKLQALQADNDKLRVNGTARAVVDELFVEMTPEQLRAYVEAQTGHAPHGSLPRNVLEGMAMSVRASAMAEAS